MISLWIFTTFTAAAAGGGGGGGGGGATRNVIVIPLGSASVKISGIRTRIPMSPTCSRKEMTVVPNRLVLSLLPDSMRLSSNIGSSYTRPYESLDTSSILFAPDLLLLRYRTPA